MEFEKEHVHMYCWKGRLLSNNTSFCIFSFLPIANEKKSLFAWETAVPYAKKKVFLSSGYEWREAVSFSLPVYTLLASTFM